MGPVAPAGGLGHEAADGPVALGAVVGDRHRLDRRVIGRDLLGERVVRLKLFEDHRAGDACGGVAAGLRDEVAFRHLAVDVAVEDLEDPRVEVTGFPAGLVGHHALPCSMAQG